MVMPADGALGVTRKATWVAGALQLDPPLAFAPE